MVCVAGAYTGTSDVSAVSTSEGLYAGKFVEDFMTFVLVIVVFSMFIYIIIGSRGLRLDKFLNLVITFIVKQLVISDSNCSDLIHMVMMRRASSSLQE